MKTLRDTQPQSTAELERWAKKIPTILAWLSNVRIFNQAELRHIYEKVCDKFPGGRISPEQIVDTALKQKVMLKLEAKIFELRPYLKNNEELQYFNETDRQTITTNITLLLIFSLDKANDLIKKVNNKIKITDYPSETTFHSYAKEVVASCERMQKTAELRALLKKQEINLAILRTIQLPTLNILPTAKEVKRGEVYKLTDSLEGLLSQRDVRKIIILYNYELLRIGNCTPSEFLNIVSRECFDGKSRQIMSAIHQIRPDIDLKAYGIAPVKRTEIPGLTILPGFQTGPHLFEGRSNSASVAFNNISHGITHTKAAQIAQLCGYDLDDIKPGATTQLLPATLFEYCRKRGEVHILISAVIQFLGEEKAKEKFSEELSKLKIK